MAVSNKKKKQYTNDFAEWQNQNSGQLLAPLLAAAGKQAEQETQKIPYADITPKLTKAEPTTSNSGGSALPSFSAMDMAKGLNHAVLGGMNQAEYGAKSGVSLAQQLVNAALGNEANVNMYANRQKRLAQEYLEQQQKLDDKYGAPTTGIGKFADQALSGAVGMAPLMPLYALPGVGQALGTGAIFLSSGGMGQGNALMEGASVEDSLKYGALSGGIEAGTERLFGGIPLQKGLINAGGKVAAKVGKESLKPVIEKGVDLLGEGVEEGIVEALDPFAQRATYNPDAENASAKDIAYAAALGTATAAIMNGAAQVPKQLPKAVKNLPNAEKVQQNDQNRAFEALHGQKMGQNQTINAQTAQNRPEKAQANGMTNPIQTPNKVAQNQSSQAVFEQNDGKNVQNRKTNDITPKLEDARQKITLEMKDRTFENVADKNVLAYQQEHPEIKPFQQETAEKLLYDLQMGEKGRREVGIDAETRNVTTMHGIKRNQSEPINRMLNDGLSYSKIEDGLNRIIEDEGSENTPNAKRVELYVHDAMRDGYNSIVDGRVSGNRNYAISNMSMEELEAETQRLTAELSAVTDEEQFAQIESQLDAIDKRMNLLKKDITPKLERAAQPEPTVEDSSVVESEPDSINNYAEFASERLKPEVREFIGTVGQKLNADVIVMDGLPKGANGLFTDGKVYLNGKNINSIKSVRAVTAHEVYHAMKNTDEFRNLQDVAMEFYRTLNPRLNNDDWVQMKIKEYGDKGVPLSVDAAYDELTADFMEVALFDAKVAERIWTEHPTLAQRIKWFIDDLLFEFRNRKLSDLEYKQAALLYNAQQMYAEGLQSMKYRGQDSGDTRYMFAGENSLTADREALARARQMEAEGADMEAIRQATGWFKSKVTGGKWAYEIDDSKADYTFMGDLNRLKNDPEYAEYMQMENNLSSLDFDANPELEKRYEYLFRKYAGTGRNNRGKTSDFVSHDALFAAYPQLVDMNWYQKDMKGTNGAYTPGVEALDMNGFVQINKSAKDPVKTSLHEMQHAIQEIEGFPGGSSAEYWGGNLDAYQNTAGEIMARDTASRNHLNTEQRRQQQPVMGDENTVYADMPKVNAAGEVVAENKDGEVRFNLATYESDGRKELQKYIRKLSNRGMIAADEGKAIIDHMEFVYDKVKELTTGENAGKYQYFTAWSEAMPVIGEDGRPVLSVVAPNIEYPMNLDFSQRCTKRVAVDNLLMYLTKNDLYDIAELSSTDFVKINEVLKKNGFDVACSMCYVEARRDKSAGWAKDIAGEYNELLSAANIQNGVVDEKSLAAKQDEMEAQGRLSKALSDRYANYIRKNAGNAKALKAADLMYSEGMADLKANAPEIYSIASSRKGASTPKPLVPETAYNNELIAPSLSGQLDARLNPAQWTPEAAFDVGGVRLQSFSDYRANMFFDYCQMFADMAARKFPAQAYTKVESFVRLFGMTGAKINMSIMPDVQMSAETRAYLDNLNPNQKEKDQVYQQLKRTAGLDANGNYQWADESFDFETAKAIQNDDRYTDNVGTVAIGVSDAHIWKMLADDDIRMIIPYHANNLNQDMAKAKNIDVFTDYHWYQNNARAKSIKEPYEDWPGYYSRISRNKKYGNKVDSKEFFFDFYGDLLDTNDPVQTAKNYVAECQAKGIIPKFPQFVYKQDGSFNENYYKLITDFTLYNKHGEPCMQTVVKFDKEHLPEDWREILMDDLAKDQAVQDKMMGEMSGVADQVLQAIGKENTGSDVRYSLPTDSSGRQLTAEQAEYFKNSKVRDDNGNLKVVYHGSPSKFYEFDWAKVGTNGTQEGKGFYFTDNEDIAWEYVNSTDGGARAFYLNIKNPLSGLEVTLSKAKVKRLLKESDKFVQQIFDDDYFLDNWGDTAYYGKDKVLNEAVDGLFKYNQSDADILYDIMNTAGIYNNADVQSYMEFITDKFGYDGIITEWLNWETGGGDTIYVAFNSNSAKLTSNQNPTDSKDIRYSMGNSRYQEMLDRYGSIEPGENPTGNNRDVKVPKQTSDFDKTRKFTRTAMEAEQVDDVTTGMIADDLTADMQSGRFIYEPTSNQKQVDRANSLINQTGWEEQAANFRAKYRSGESMSADDIALGERLIQEAQKAGDYQMAVDLIADVAAIGTEAGRSVQALKILKRLTPEGQLMALKRIEQRINSSLAAQQKPPVALPESIAEEMLQARGSEKQAEIWDNAIKELANQVPATFADKVNAWRYLAMLSNPKTHIRNMVGNATMRAVMGVKNVVQTGIETTLSPFGIERTAAIKVPKEYRDFAKWDFENNAKKMLEAGGGRYNDEIGLVSQNKQIFKNPVLETARKKNTELLEAEDMLFKKSAYIDAMARYMKANGLSPSVLQNQSAGNNATYEKAQNYAVEQARKATFQEASKLAQKLSEIENMNAAGKVLIGALVPFKKTPINILKRGMEYSPVGIINGVKKAVFDVKKGEATPAEVIEAMSAGLTGTGIMMVGYFLASMGLLSTGADDDDQRKARYDSQMGNQNYALVLPDGSTYTIDWLAPSVMPMMVGAELYKQLSGEQADSNNATGFTKAIEALTRVGNPLLEMSMMQGLTEAVQSYNSGTGQFLSDFLISAGTGFAGQFIPAPVSALARTMDDTVRSSYAPKDSPLMKEGESFLRQQRSKIPALPLLNELGVTSISNQPSIDLWGNERKREGDTIAERAFHNFINPGTYSSNKRTTLDNKLDKLYEATGDSNVLPKSADSYVKYDGQTYYKSPFEKTRYDTTKGQKSKQYVTDFINSSAYRTLDDTTKAGIVKEMYDLADYQAKKEMLIHRGIRNYSDSDYENVLKSGVAPGKYYAAKEALSGIEASGNNTAKDNKIAYLQKMKNSGEITDRQFWYMRKAIIGKFNQSEMAACPYADIKNM